jgi:hypothetical protein
VVSGVLVIATSEETANGRKSTTHLILRAVNRLVRAGGRRTEGDAPHLLEGIAAVVYDPQSGRLDPGLPSKETGLRWTEFVETPPVPTIRVSVRARLPRPWKAILTPSELDEADAVPIEHALDRSPRQPRSFAYAVAWPTSDVANSRNESRALGSLKSPLGPVARDDMMRHAES